MNRLIAFIVYGTPLKMLKKKYRKSNWRKFINDVHDIQNIVL